MSVFPKPTGPFEQAAEAYRDAGMGSIALPRGAKAPPVPGTTGKEHRGLYTVTDADLRHHAAYYPGGNLGVRLPEDVIALDEDVRDKGDTTLAALEARLGLLPPTLTNTARTDGSKHHFYRVPDGLRWHDAGPGVQVLWWGYRYAVAWPTVHPDTGTLYTWYAADGTALPGIPPGGWKSEEIATLPDAWVEYLTKGAAAEDADAGPVEPLRPSVARARIDGALAALAKAGPGERNHWINYTAYTIGGIWARVPEEHAVDDLDGDALQDEIRDVFAAIDVDPHEPKANDTLSRGWEAGVRDPMTAGADRPGHGDQDATVDFGEPTRGKIALDVTNPDTAYKTACRLLGTGSLAGVFRRGDSLVHAPRIGEDGYLPLTDDDRDEDGPAQVRRLDIPGLRAFVAHHAGVFKKTVPQGQKVAVERDALLPTEVAGLLTGAPRYVTGARTLRGVVHTPVVLADGSLLSEPGYHEATGVLLLPELDVPVPDGQVTGEQVRAAVGLLDTLLGPPGCGPGEGFPFVTVDDRATYLAAMLTPLLREVVPPPYPLVAIGAPTPGSGKSYLATILRTLHGGVFRAEMPRHDEELRKQITSILDQTSAPVVTFDNLSGLFQSARFDGLLTSPTWTDRVLGETREVDLPNNRLWTVTGNNLRFGGDMRRRVRWVTLDAKMARPEERMFELNPKAFASANRGALLGALLTLVVGWVQAGRPEPVATRSDDFTRWTQVTQGVLTWAGVDGTVGGSEREGGTVDEEDADVLAALWDVYGDGVWTAGAVVEAAAVFNTSLQEALPQPGHGGRPSAKSLGQWLSRWQDRPTQSGLVLRKTGHRTWRIELEDPQLAHLSPEDRALL